MLKSLKYFRIAILNHTKKKIIKFKKNKLTNITIKSLVNKVNFVDFLERSRFLMMFF